MRLIRKYLEVVDHSGIDWYRQGHTYCKSLSDKYNVLLVSVCGVMSALSPGTNWEQNKKDTVALLSDAKYHKFTTYGQNVAKARRILTNGVAKFSPITGPKTYNFFFNLLEPDNPLFVTVDRHAYTIATDQIYTGIHAAEYRRIAQRYIKAADFIGDFT